MADDVAHDGGAVCVLCDRRAKWGVVCTRCRGRVDGNLGGIVDMYATLPEHMERGRAPGQRVSGSREAPLPLLVDALDLSMPAPTGRRLWTHVRDDRGDQGGRPSVAGVLDSWVREWRSLRAMREHAPVPTVAELVGWLRNRLDWVCDRDDADDVYAISDFAAEMRELHSALRAVCGLRSDAVHIGWCPVVDEERGRACGTRLAADPYVTVVKCPGCDALWPRDKWLWLGLTVTVDGGEAAAA